MIKTFKWIYKLGVQHERLRIKKIFAEFAAAYHDDLEQINFTADRHEHASLKKHKLEVKAEAMRCISNLMTPPTSGQIITDPAPIDEEIK